MQQNFDLRGDTRVRPRGLGCGCSSPSAKAWRFTSRVDATQLSSRTNAARSRDLDRTACMRAPVRLFDRVSKQHRIVRSRERAGTSRRRRESVRKEVISLYDSSRWTGILHNNYTLVLH